LFPLLVLFLVLGHVCELPVCADLALSSHPTGADHRHATDHDPDALQISCDAVDVLSTTGSPHGKRSLDVAEALPIASPIPVRFVTSAEAIPRLAPFAAPLSPAAARPLHLPADLSSRSSRARHPRFPLDA
jgi:hypothetical protein